MHEYKNTLGQESLKNLNMTNREYKKTECNLVLVFTYYLEVSMLVFPVGYEFVQNPNSPLL